MSDFNFTIIDKARQYAMDRFAGQKDDSGEDAVWHSLQVGMLLSLVKPADANLIAGGYLHDVIEDCNITREELTNIFNEDIATLVWEVTKIQPDKQQAAFFPNLKSYRAKLIKFADRLSNISRMQPWSPKRRESYLRHSKFWRESLHDGHRTDDMAYCYDCQVMINEDGTETPKKEKNKDLIRLLAELLQNIEVPRSIGVTALGKGVDSYDAIVENLDLFGWQSADGIETALRENLQQKEVTKK